MTLDEKTVELAVTAARMARESGDPTKFICQAGWQALSLLHDLMTSKNQIQGIYKIGADQKLRLWTLACLGSDGSKFKRVSISKAILMYEIINEGFGRVIE